ncbi:reverse transcriptase domain-containing protein [Tanacetum coccineum]
MVPATTPLVGFSGEIIWPLGKISLLVKIGDDEHSTSAWMNFIVVRSPSPYNGIIGRPGVRRIHAVISTAHGPGTQQLVINQVTEEKIKVAFHPEYLEQTIAIGSTLTEEGRTELCVEHKLNIREGCLPVRQKKRRQAPERNKAIHKEVEKLVNAGIIKEVHYHSWLSNPVMVKKHDDNWRMCVDFKDLNKAYPKDGYPLPEIDWKVESLCGYPFKCFLDAYKGYHQIKMAEKDEEKTTFITSQRIFCYTKMPFGLKNAGATYQRLVDKAFQKQIGRNLEVYVDDIVIKRRKEQEVCPDKVEVVLKKSNFQWIEEAEMAFKQMKKLIAELPMLTAPKEKEELIIYLADAKEAISTVLMMEKDGKQMPIYFVSHALQGPEINYTPMEKQLTLILSNLEVTGRLFKWSFELEEHDIYYRPRTSVKGQILADFSVERLEDDPSDTPMEDKEELSDPWTLFDATNNETEYGALIAGLRIAEQIGVKNLQENVDSWLVANQVNGCYIAKEPGIIKYLEKVRALISAFKEFSIKQVPRGENKKANALSKMASTSFAHLSKQVLVEELKEKSIDEKEVLAVAEEGCTWMTPIHEYLTE